MTKVSESSDFYGQSITRKVYFGMGSREENGDTREELLRRVAAGEISVAEVSRRLAALDCRKKQSRPRQRRPKEDVIIADEVEMLCAVVVNRYVGIAESDVQSACRCALEHGVELASLDQLVASVARSWGMNLRQEAQDDAVQAFREVFAGSQGQDK